MLLFFQMNQLIILLTVVIPMQINQNKIRILVQDFGHLVPFFFLCFIFHWPLFCMLTEIIELVFHLCVV